VTALFCYRVNVAIIVGATDYSTYVVSIWFFIVKVNEGLQNSYMLYVWNLFEFLHLFRMFHGGWSKLFIVVEFSQYVCMINVIFYPETSLHREMIDITTKI
jgi:hypothetical protein